MVTVRIVSDCVYGVRRYRPDDVSFDLINVGHPLATDPGPSHIHIATRDVVLDRDTSGDTNDRTNRDATTNDGADLLSNPDEDTHADVADLPTTTR